MTIGSRPRRRQRSKMNPDLMPLLVTFASTQRGLLELVTQDQPSGDLSHIQALPRSGSVQLMGAEWTFKKHGVGLEFRNTQTGEVIDAHDHIELPEAFDAWRITLYCESRKLAHLLHQGSEHGTSTPELHSLFDALTRRGELLPVTATGRHFQMPSTRPTPPLKDCCKGRAVDSGIAPA